MYTGGSVKETLAFIDGYRCGSPSPISGRVFDQFVCIRNSFPSNYVWTYVIQSCSKDEHEAFRLIEETIKEFVELKEKLSDDEILKFAAGQKKEEGAAEKVFKKFDKALLMGNGELIKTLIEDHKDVSVLLQDAYPSEVATKLGEISTDEPIKCIPISDEGDRVNIIAQGWPFPIEMNLVDGSWLINAEKIIELRKTNMMFAPPPKATRVTIKSTNCNDQIDFYSHLGILFDKDLIEGERRCYTYVYGDFHFEIQEVTNESEASKNLELRFFTDDIQAYLDGLKEMGIQTVKNLWTTKDHQHIQLKDPDGNLVELVTVKKSA